MIRLCFFARFREKLGTSAEDFPLDSAVPVSEVVARLAGRGGPWLELFDCPRGVMVAINQQMGTLDSVVAPGDELALFPPVTGG